MQLRMNYDYELFAGTWLVKVLGQIKVYLFLRNLHKLPSPSLVWKHASPIVEWSENQEGKQKGPHTVMQHQHSSKGLTSKVTTEKKMNNQPVKANKRNPSGMCSRIKREGIPETHCLQSARTRARRGVMRLFIMMSDLRSCGYSTRCIERENCSFCRAVALCKREMTHNVPRTARCLNDWNVGRQSPAIATRPSDACICSSPSAYKYMITTVS